MSVHDAHFAAFRRQTIGADLELEFPGGRRKLLYADWAASGRLYRPIEDYVSGTLGPFVANTHTETNLTGCTMTSAYHQAQKIIKDHVGASPEDVIFFSGFGMTAVVNKFQRLMGLRVTEQFKEQVALSQQERPLVIITHMEHHSNQTTWEECVVDMAIIRRRGDGTPDLDHLRDILRANRHRRQIIGSFSACSNVTGIISPYHEMAELVHEFGGICCVDFSASAPYVSINMHPDNEKQALDVVFFSPHKFLGGPGSSGVMVCHRRLYSNKVPDHPGGGTVMWTNPWGGHRFYDDIEVREDGGTPGFLQAIRGALAVLLKENMEIGKILQREEFLKSRLLNGLARIPFIQVLEAEQTRRLGFISFYSKELHHNLIVKLLNDYFGVQVRGGCSCAGTYGHILLGVDQTHSRSITEKIDHGDLSDKPGWVRISLHPTMTETEVDTIVEGIDEVIRNYDRWGAEYRFDPRTAEYELASGAASYVDLRSTFRP